ncbi:MAG: hypothetical protein II893_01160 [Methanomicrobium sp.]|nr:hypothetical protein [Methanomicrobium sp.]
MRSKTKISDDNAEWILLMGFVVSFAIIFLAILLNLSVAAGQTPSDSVTEFPKSQIRDIRAELTDAAVKSESESDFEAKLDAIRKLALARDNAVVEANLTYVGYADAEYGYAELTVHYNNGVTEYDGTYLLPKKL